MSNGDADTHREAQLAAGEEKCKSAWRGVSEQYGVWRSSAWNALTELLVKYPRQSGVIQRALRTVALDPALDPLHLPACWPLPSDDAWTDSRALRSFVKTQQKAVENLRAVMGEINPLTAPSNALPNRSQDLDALSSAISEYEQLVASEQAYDKEVAAFDALFKGGCDTMLYAASGRKFFKRAALQARSQ